MLRKIATPPVFWKAWMLPPTRFRRISFGSTVLVDEDVPLDPTVDKSYQAALHYLITVAHRLALYDSDVP